MKKQRIFLLLFFVFFNAVSIVYFSIVASDQFISEAHFAIRSQQSQSNADLGLVLGLGFSNSSTDADIAATFIKSRDAIDEIDKRIGLTAHYSNLNVDYLSRFGRFFEDLNSKQDFLSYMKGKIAIHKDPSQSVSVLTVSSFSPELSQKTSELLLALSEEKINELNQRGQKDLIEFAQAQLSEAEERIKGISKRESEMKSQSNRFSLAKFERLRLDKELAYKQLELRHIALMQVKDESSRQALYLTRISEPSFPDTAQKPERLKSMLTVLLLTLLFIFLAEMFMNATKEHYD